MSVKIGSNISSLNAQRRLGEIDTALSSTFERLASGQRINRASDDAAGLAIADDLNARSRIYTQAIRNGNDGISLLNIADSALDALSGVVVRIRELSEQSANGTYSYQQRAALDAEAQALTKEFTRITQTTSFNGIRIFDGSLGQGVRLQLGVGLSESINASIGGSIGTGSFNTASLFSSEGGGTGEVVFGDLNNDNILDMVTAGGVGGNGFATIRLGRGDGSFGVSYNYTSEGFTSFAVGLTDLNGDGRLDLVTAGRDDSTNGTATIRLGNGNGTFGNAVQYTTEQDISYTLGLSDLNGDGYIDLVTAGLDASSNGIATVRLGNGNGTFANAVQYSTELGVSNSLKLADLNGDGIVDLVTTGKADANTGWATIRLGIGDGSFGSATQYTTLPFNSNGLDLKDLNNDGFLDLVTSGRDNSNNGAVTVRLGTGNGTFGSLTSYSTEGFSSDDMTLGDINGDGHIDLIASGRDDSFNGTTSIRLGQGNGTFGAITQFATQTFVASSVVLEDLNRDGVLDMINAGSNLGVGYVQVRLANTREGLGAMLNFSLKSKSDALKSMNMLDRTLENLAKQRGQIGASQSRVSIAISNLQTSRENFKAAESRIRDADIASESASLLRTQILQQAAASVLSQANNQPQIALQLLT